MEIRAFNEAARALMVWAALSEDEALGSPDAAARQAADDRLGLLTPVLKGVFTDVGFANAVKAQQVLGGHGYISEWGMEQFVRDARIAMIYEGANGIQALDLVGRKLPKDGGRAATAFFAEVTGFLAREQGGRRAGALSRAAEGRARPVAAGDDVADAERMKNPDNAGAASTDYMHLFGLVALRLHVGANRQSRAGASGGRDEQRGARRQTRARQFYNARMLPRAPRISRASRAGRKR